VTESRSDSKLGAAVCKTYAKFIFLGSISKDVRIFKVSKLWTKNLFGVLQTVYHNFATSSLVW